MDPKILLINPPSNSVEDDRVEPPLGLMYLAAVLREKNYRFVSILDLTGKHENEKIPNIISNIPHANIYGISCLSSNYIYAKRIVCHIKYRDPGALVVIGGAHPTALPEHTLHNTSVDMVVTGEGEDAFTEIVRQFTLKDFFKKAESIVHGNGRLHIDEYPFPTRDLIDYTTYSRRLNNSPVASLISSRGCAYRCIYCNSIIMGGGSKSVRYRSPENIILELNKLKPFFSCYRFNDDNFTGNPRLFELLVQLKELKINFRIFARLRDLTDETCRLLKEAGCVHVSIGLESLNADNLFAIGKGDQIDQEGNLIFAKNHNLTVRGFFIVGLPYDNDETIKINFMKAATLGIDEFSIYPLIPYPGTLLWKDPSRFGYDIIDRDFTDYIQIGKGGKTCYALKHKNFNSKDVERWKEMATNILSDSGMKHMKESKIAT